MRTSPGYFRVDGDGFVPEPLAVSQWSSDQVVGPAVCGLLARMLEVDHGGDGFAPVRLTVDMFAPARMRPLSVVSTRVRDGNRIRVADAVLRNEQTPVARATVVFLRPSEQPPGEIWTRERQPAPPPLELAPPSDGPEVPWFGSDAGGPWAQVFGVHENSSRKRTWQHPMNVLAGEELSPFVRATLVGEQTSMVTNWSDAGIGFINTDVTLALARMPVGTEIGAEADNHLSRDGVAVGTATLFDREGAFGSSMVTALANAGRQISVGRLDRKFSNANGGRRG
ncbi:acyl-CoA thioesterase domain-containing protein [Nocardia sp. alder85J]|uniref:acyl-CoA thioesterase domain-containing protein n=1 Tax=Nocardia sp. alder85J TaxID=2862949 RepID=UPI001CD74548|nr:acyl-CoA thioesterase domain-containing protein [Nocardia sp. alder85J]MCX4092620.1 thioesterase family protein [Nocardia sp. alder85J]